MSAVGGKPVYAIFLDIDGVLNVDIPGGPGPDQMEWARKQLFPESAAPNRNQRKMMKAQFLDKVAVGRFQRLVDCVSEVAKVVIVLTSTWRRSWNMNQPITDMFRGWSFSEYLIDRTPDIHYSQRQREIDLWLLQNRKEHNVQKFVILDDDTEIVSGPQVVPVNKDRLLQYDDIERAYAILSLPSPETYFAQLEEIQV